MPRLGTNPMRWVEEIPHTPKTTITTIVFIPYLSGYWEKSLDVLKLCINSIIKTVNVPFDLMVFDNGSCTEVQEYLFQEKRNGKIQYLMLSEKNIGKVAAWNIVFPAAPGELVVYTDSDILFFPGWYEQSLEIMEAFPKAGMVTAQPGRGRPNFYKANSAALNDIPRNPSISLQQGHIISDSILENIRLGLRYSEAYYKKHNLDAHPDFQVSQNNRSAFLSASHFEFMTRKSILQQLIPFEITRLYGGDAQLDLGINKLGYWNLSTQNYLVHHMGNDPSDIPCPSGGETPVSQSKFSTNAMNKNRAVSKFYSVMRYFLKYATVKIIVKKINKVTFNLLSIQR